MASDDYRPLYGIANVFGVSHEPDGTLVALVDEKVPESELHDHDVIATAIEDVTRAFGIFPPDESDVVEVGQPSIHDEGASWSPGLEETVADPTPAQHRKRRRPPRAGLSEINVDGTAATAGTLAVDDDSGERVRVSNQHVYGLAGRAASGSAIVQPSPIDTGEAPADKVGEYIRGITMVDGTKADAAIRSLTDAERQQAPKAETIYGLGTISQVRRTYSKMNGVELAKSGRTTGVSRNAVKATQANIRVRYGKDRIVERKDVLVLDPMSRGGDSGSPLVRELSDESANSTLELVGHVFAGSKRATIADKAKNIEDELNVTFLLFEEPEPDEPPRDEPPRETPDEPGKKMSLQDALIAVLKELATLLQALTLYIERSNRE